MDKRLIPAIFFLLLFSGSVFAAISGYKVPPQIPVGKNLVVSGQLSSFTETDCSFFIYDANDGAFVYQLSDEKTTNNGYISTSYFVLPGINQSGEQILFQDRNYTVTTRCGSDQADANFMMVKPVPLNDKAANLFIWIGDNFIAVIFGFLLVVLIAAFLWWLLKRQ